MEFVFGNVMLGKVYIEQDDGNKMAFQDQVETDHWMDGIRPIPFLDVEGSRVTVVGLSF